MLFQQYSGDLQEASQDALQQAADAEKHLLGSAEELRTVALQVGNNATQITSELHEQIGMTEKLRNSMEEQSDAVGAMTDRSGERIERMAEGLRKQAADVTDHLEGVLEKQYKAVDHVLTTAEHRMDGLKNQVDEQVSLLSQGLRSLLITTLVKSV